MMGLTNGLIYALAGSLIFLSAASPEDHLHIQSKANVRRDGITISDDPEMFTPLATGCEYKWTSMLEPGSEIGQLYTADGFSKEDALPGFPNDFALGSAAAALAINLDWTPQVWAWIDEDSSQTIVKVDLKGPNAVEVIMSDTLPQGQNTNPGCYEYFGYTAPHDDGEPPVMQMALVEKALAITKGGYKALDGLTAADAFAILTDQPGTVSEGKVGSENGDLLTAISDAVTNGQPCVVEFIVPSDLESFDGWNDDKQEVELAIGTLKDEIVFEGTTTFTTSGGKSYNFQGGPVMYTSVKSSGDGYYFWNIGIFDPAADGQDDDPNDGLFLPSELLPYIAKTVTTWSPPDDGSGISARFVKRTAARSSRKAAKSSSDPAPPLATLLGQSSKCTYTYKEPPPGKVFDIRGLKKEDVDQGPFPDCAIGSSTLALMHAKQFSMQMSRTMDPADSITYIYGSFYSGAKGSLVQVRTGTKLLVATPETATCAGYEGYQADNALYVPYLEKLLASFLDNRPDLMPKGQTGKGYNRIANIPIDFVMTAISGKAVASTVRPNTKAYFPDFSTAAINLMTTKPNSNGATPAVVIGTVTPEFLAAVAKNSKNPKATWDGTTYTVALPSGTAKIVKVVFAPYVAWKVSITGQQDVFLFAHHGYAIVGYDSGSSMFTIANPFQFNYNAQGKRLDGAELKVHKSVIDIFGLALYSVSP